MRDAQRARSKLQVTFGFQSSIRPAGLASQIHTWRYQNLPRSKGLSSWPITVGAGFSRGCAENGTMYSTPVNAYSPLGVRW